MENIIDPGFNDNKVYINDKHHNSALLTVVQQKVWVKCDCFGDPNEPLKIRVIPGLQQGWSDDFPLNNVPPTVDKSNPLWHRQGNWSNTDGNIYYDHYHTKDGVEARYKLPVQKWRLVSQKLTIEALEDSIIDGHFFAYRTIHPSDDIIDEYIAWYGRNLPDGGNENNNGHLDFSTIKDYVLPDINKYLYDNSFITDSISNIGNYDFVLNNRIDETEFRDMHWKLHMDKFKHMVYPPEIDPGNFKADDWHFNQAPRAFFHNHMERYHNYYDKSFDNIVICIFTDQMLDATQLKIKCVAHHEYIFDVHDNPFIDQNVIPNRVARDNYDYQMNYLPLLQDLRNGIYSNDITLDVALIRNLQLARNVQAGWNNEFRTPLRDVADTLLGETDSEDEDIYIQLNNKPKRRINRRFN